ncbi:hypothetical protein AUC45_10855 [Erythrobacter sp. YT30]|nr:hypothetical protein AUC45_10855 [Erythrobacter sp. YT30]
MGTPMPEDAVQEKGEAMPIRPGLRMATKTVLEPTCMRNSRKHGITHALLLRVGAWGALSADALERLAFFKRRPLGKRVYPARRKRTLNHAGRARNNGAQELIGQILGPGKGYLGDTNANH